MSERRADIAHVRDSVGEAQRTEAMAHAVVEKMVGADAFSRFMGMESLEVAPKRSVVRMTVRGDMLNGLGGVHGGAVYALADTAFSYATNGCGYMCVAIDCTISYPAASKVGDVLTAIAVQESNSNKLAFCNVTVRNQHEVIVGHFRGTVYRTPKPHFPEQVQEGPHS
jgi:acyl-CoA thioesterase